MEDAVVREKYLGKRVRCIDPSWAKLLKYEQVYEVTDAFLIGKRVFFVLKDVDYQGVPASRFEDEFFDGVDHYGKAYRYEHFQELVKEARTKGERWGGK